MRRTPVRRSLSLSIASAGLLAGMLASGGDAVAVPTSIATSGPVAVGLPLMITGTNLVPSSTFRLVVIPGHYSFIAPGLYLGNPTAISTADGNTDGSGAFGATTAWSSVEGGSYTILALQSSQPASPTTSGAQGRTFVPDAVGDHDINAVLYVDIVAPAPVPALSRYGLLALAAALGLAGWAVVGRVRS